MRLSTVNESNSSYHTSIRILPHSLISFARLLVCSLPYYTIKKRELFRYRIESIWQQNEIFDYICYTEMVLRARTKFNIHFRIHPLWVLVCRCYWARASIKKETNSSSSSIRRCQQNGFINITIPKRLSTTAIHHDITARCLLARAHTNGMRFTIQNWDEPFQLNLRSSLNDC